MLWRSISTSMYSDSRMFLIAILIWYNTISRSAHLMSMTRIDKTTIVLSSVICGVLETSRWPFRLQRSICPQTKWQKRSVGVRRRTPRSNLINTFAELKEHVPVTFIPHELAVSLLLTSNPLNNGRVHCTSIRYASTIQTDEVLKTGEMRTSSVTVCLKRLDFN